MIENLQFIGTSHIAKQSIDEIKKAIATFKPNIIAVELDAQRAQALFEKEPTKISFLQITNIGIKGYLFMKLGQIIQQRLGRMVGIAPGSEMKTAIEGARREKLSIAFIDQPIQITLKKLSQRITWKERCRFSIDIIKSLFFPQQQLQKIGLKKFDLKTVPGKETIKQLMKIFSTRYPSIYNVLVEERNRYMIKKLIKLLRENPDQKILVIVGAGHEEGMKELLLKADVVRLSCKFH